MKLVAGTAIALAGLGAIASTASAVDSQESFAGGHVRIENFIGRIEIRNGGSGIRVEVRNPGDAAEDPVAVATSGGVEIDGGQSVRNLNCRTNNGNIRIGRWMSSRPIEDYPTLVITAPATLDFELADSAFVGEAGDLGSLDLSMNSCGRFEAGDIAGRAGLRINGSGDVTVGEIGGDADFSVNGSGDIVTGDIAGGADIGINGSGDIRSGNVGGDTEIGINGSGDVELADIASLDIEISGSGDVEARSMRGAFSAGIAGSGDIVVHDGRADPFEARINGSGDIRFGGTAVNITVRESGGGDIEIGEIEGSVDWRRNGRTVLRSGSSD
jgi:hypothetical protein